jgi:hypothetical protein
MDGSGQCSVALKYKIVTRAVMALFVLLLSTTPSNSVFMRRIIKVFSKIIFLSISNTIFWVGMLCTPIIGYAYVENADMNVGEKIFYGLIVTACAALLLVIISAIVLLQRGLGAG